MWNKHWRLSDQFVDFCNKCKWGKSTGIFRSWQRLLNILFTECYSINGVWERLEFVPKFTLARFTNINIMGLDI